MDSIILSIILALTSYTLASSRLIRQGDEALVERLGRYHSKRKPGLNFIVPLVDKIVLKGTTREQFIDIKSQNLITKDNIYLVLDTILFWRIRDIERSFYAIDDFQGALIRLATTTLRQIIAHNTLEETNLSRLEMERDILDQLNNITADWGVEILRFNIKSITLPESMQKLIEEERVLISKAETTKTSIYIIAEAERHFTLMRAESITSSMRLFSESLPSQLNAQEVLQLLLEKNDLELGNVLTTKFEGQKNELLLNYVENKELHNNPIESDIDSTILAALDNISNVYERYLAIKDYAKATEAANSAYEFCQNIAESLDREKQRNIYSRVIALAEYWKLDRDLYRRLVQYDKE